MGMTGPGTDRITCPRCGSGDVWPIVYGMPDPDSVARGGWDGLVMGGCVVDPDNPTRACQACHHRWQHPGDQATTGA